MSDSNLKWQCSHAQVPVFRYESCDVSEHHVCLQLSAPWGFDLISFAWHIHTPCAGICVKEAELALLRGSSSPVQDIFGPVCGWELCGCQADRGCRGRVRIKEDVVSSSKPHDCSQLPAYLSPQPETKTGSWHQVSAFAGFWLSHSLDLCAYVDVTCVSFFFFFFFFRLRLFWCVRTRAGSSLNSVCVVFAKAWVWREHLRTWQLDLTEMNGKPVL